MLQVKCTAELCRVESWWLRFGLLRSGCVVFISLKQGRLYAMRDRSTTRRAKTASELQRKYIVISLCKETIKFCIEFKAKRTRGNNNTLWMLFHHSATLIVSCFTMCLLLEMLLTVNELPLEGLYHHIPFKCLGLELLPWCSLLFDTKDSKLFCETVTRLPFSEWPPAWYKCQWLFKYPFTRAQHGLYDALSCNLIHKILCWKSRQLWG